MTRCMLTEDASASLQLILAEMGLYVTGGLHGAIEGILWRIRTGSPWRDIPKEFGTWNSVYRLYNRWVTVGILDRLLEVIEGKIDYRSASIDGICIPVYHHASGCSKDQESGIGISRGGRTTKIHAVCDRQDSPVTIEVTHGNVSDVVQAEGWMI